MIPTRNGTRKSTWIQAGLVMLVLLLVPIAALLLFPSPTPPPREAESEKPRMLPASSASRVELPAVTKPDVKALSSAKDPVRGRVLDGDGKGIAGASVRCEGEEPAAATSVEDGRFELPLGVDGCDAKASHPDYGVSELVHLTIGGAGVLVLPMPGSIVGNVVDERGLPVSAFLIAVESFTAPGQQPDLEGRPHKSISDPSGGFELPRLSRGRYILTASAEGRPPTRSESVLVEPGNVTRGVRIKLLRGIALSGIVTDKETKRPLASVGVALDGMTNTGANAIDPATTGADGAYSLDGAPKGTFSVRFSHAGYRDRIVSFDGTGKSEIKGNVDLVLASDGKSLELSNVGAMLGQNGENVTVAVLIAGGPAEKAGVQEGDRVVSIDGSSAVGLTRDDCVQRLRGPEGSRVSLVVSRGNKTLEFNLTRAIVTR